MNGLVESSVIQPVELLRQAAAARTEARRLVRETRELVAASPGVFDPREMVHRCAWCGRVSRDEIEWWDVTEVSTHMLRLTSTHGICPDCVEDLVKTGHSRPVAAESS